MTNQTRTEPLDRLAELEQAATPGPWKAGSLVCGCPKFITPAVQRYRMARFAARGQQ